MSWVTSRRASPIRRTPGLLVAGIPSHVMKSGTGSDAKMKGALLAFVLGAEVTMSYVLLILSGLEVKGALGTVQPVGAFPIDDVLTGRFVLESLRLRDRRASLQLLRRTGAQP